MIKLKPSRRITIYLIKTIPMSNKKLITSIIVSSVFLVSCGGIGYTRDMSYMPDSLKAQHEKTLSEQLEKYKNTSKDEEKSTYAGEIGFQYMELGQFNEAITYYEEVLKQHPTDFASLNNIARMYEEAGKIKEALTYQQKLYETNSTNTQVIDATIRLLVANSQFDDAQGLLEKFTVTEQGKKETAFVSGQYELILKAREKQQKSRE